MPNWSNTEITLSSKDKEKIKFLRELGSSFEKNGLNAVEDLKMPEIFNEYRADEREMTVILDKDWNPDIHEKIEEDENDIFNKKKFIKTTELANIKEKHGCFGWYTWAHVNWGTKWNVEADKVSFEEEDGEGVLTLKFHSAWAGPDKWFQAVVAMHQLDGVYYDEEIGWDFINFIKMKNGKLVEHKQDTYISKLRVEMFGIDSVIEEIYNLYEGENNIEDLMFKALYKAVDLNEKELKELIKKEIGNLQ